MMYDTPNLGTVCCIIDARLAELDSVLFTVHIRIPANDTKTLYFSFVSFSVDLFLGVHVI